MNSTRNHPQKGNKLEGLMEGREEGREEGIRASRFEIACNLKTMGVATEMIIQATKLTTEEFEHL